MIYRQDVLQGKFCPLELEDNLLELLTKVNKIYDAYQIPLVVTSGYRSKEDQINIYIKKGVKDLTKIPMKSRHLTCEAVDLYDPKGQLQQWILKNRSLMEEIGLWFEDFKYTPKWVHAQTRPPRSGSLFFKP
jgi:uncharacterized protein YcbK (DUF882 family)